MFLINLDAESVACILSFRKSRHKPNLERSSKYGFSPDLGGKNGGVLSMRMRVILDSSFARPGSAPIWGGKKGEFRDWTKVLCNTRIYQVCNSTATKAASPDLPQRLDQDRSLWKAFSKHRAGKSSAMSLC